MDGIKLILIFTVVIVLVVLCYIIIRIRGNEVTSALVDENFKMQISNFFNGDRSNCSEEILYCFSNTDCSRTCVDSDKICQHGLCKAPVMNPIDWSETCDATKGMVGYLIGNTALGDYEFICKSIDPAIAISNTENRMCFDGSIEIDYNIAYPASSSCVCSHPVYVPATKEKREHVECSDIFYDLVSY